MPLDLFGDFGLVGAEDSTAAAYQDKQQLINWYVEVAASKRAKVPAALLGTPGLIRLLGNAPILSTLDTLSYSPITTLSGTSLVALNYSSWPFPSTVTNLPVRALWPLSGQAQALAVVGNQCYLVTITSGGSTSIPGVLAWITVGTLNTFAGPVHIRDDGLGNNAVIVDGTYGYLYNIKTRKLTTITDPAFPGASTVAFIDGWWIFSEPNSQEFFTNSQPYSLTFDATYFANKDAFSDRLMAVIESKEELWLIGETTTEIWYNAGAPYFPFQRLVGTMLQVGCKATHSVARFSSDNQDGLIWLGRSDRGENVIVKTIGFSIQVVSTPAVSNAIAEYVTTSDAIGYTYQEDGHEFYVLTFPTADRTWVFDASVPIEFAWHQRLSYDPYLAQFHRHRSNCCMNFGGMRVVGDYQNGSLYQLTRAAYTDAGWPLLARRRSPHVWDAETRQRVFMASLQVDFAPGQGTASGVGRDPVANLRISRDGGTTFGQQWPRPMGQMGRFRTRTKWNRLGVTRDSVFELETIAPVNRDITGATLKAQGL